MINDLLHAQCMSQLLLFLPACATHTHRPVVPMDYMGEEYFKLKATVIKYERFLLKVN